MAVLVQIVPAAVFSAIFDNRQRAVVLDALPALAPGDLVELTDGKRRCQRLATDVAGDQVHGLPHLRLVSLRPLTATEKAARMTGEGLA
jgi:hypothetical protein